MSGKIAGRQDKGVIQAGVGDRAVPALIAILRKACLIDTNGVHSGPVHTQLKSLA